MTVDLTAAPETTEESGEGDTVGGRRGVRGGSGNDVLTGNAGDNSSTAVSGVTR